MKMEKLELVNEQQSKEIEQLKQMDLKHLRELKRREERAGRRRGLHCGLI